jgi:hypothetical protein
MSWLLSNCHQLLSLEIRHNYLNYELLMRWECIEPLRIVSSRRWRNPRRRNRGSDSTRYASQQLTEQGPRRHNRRIGSPEAVGLDVGQFKHRLKRMLGLGRCLEVAQRI